MSESIIFIYYFIKTFVFDDKLEHSLSLYYKIENGSLISLDDINYKEYERTYEEEKRVDD